MEKKKKDRRSTYKELGFFKNKNVGKQLLSIQGPKPKRKVTGNVTHILRHLGVFFRSFATKT